MSAIVMTTMFTIITHVNHINHLITPQLPPHIAVITAMTTNEAYQKLNAPPDRLPHPQRSTNRLYPLTP